MSSPAEASTNDPARIVGTLVGEHYQVLRCEDKLISARFVREAKAMSMFEHRNEIRIGPRDAVAVAFRDISPAIRHFLHRLVLRSLGMPPVTQGQALE